MVKIAQIDDRGATTAWSPVRSHAEVIALGAKDSGGSGFDDTGGELELYDLNMSSGATTHPMLLGSVKTQSRFASLGWSPGGVLGSQYNMGLLAGGMENGTVHVWNPRGVMAQQESLVASYTQHASGPVKALQFSTLNPTQLATGGSDGKVLISNLEKGPESVVAPCDDQSQKAQITSVAWNTQVGHVLASSAADGTVAVWDLKSRKAWCELRGETAGQSVSDIAWNPTQGLHLLTASGDDRNPVLKLWDLRASTSMPLATLAGHQSGILSIAWCPHDEHLLLSTGKDNRTILWDLFTLKPIADVPNDAVSLQESTNSGSDAMFAAGGLASSQQRRYDVQWSPIKRGVASTCSLDRKVQAHSILGLSGKSGRPPKWLRPSSSVSFGFGGSVVSCGSENKIVSLSTVVEQPQLQQVSDTFEGTIESTNVVDFCKDLAYKARDPGEAQLWGFMQVIFETNARQELLDHLGFDPTAIANAAAAYKEDTTSNGVESMSLKDQPPNVGMSKPAEEMVKKALLVGNFEAAVDCCFRIGNLADALVLASCGGADLWAKTQARYFKVESSKRPFLSIVSAIIHTQLEELVRCSNPKKWQETLAILSTYGKSDEFPTLCIALGDLLETSGDPRSASLCYMCALSLDEAVKFWRAQLDLANKEKQTDGMDLLALHEFVVKVSVFLKAAGPSAVLDPKDADLFSKYAEKLSEQGLLVAAAKYCKGEGEDSRILRDRLYRSKASPACLAAMGGSPPEFPFTLANIQQSRGQTSGAETRKNQQQQAAAAIQQQEVAAAAAAAIHQNNQNTSQQSNTPQNYTRQESSNSATSANGQQSQYNQQQQYGQHTAAQTAQPTQAAPDALPAGWVALQDPSSGSMYYANQATGEVTWEKPQDAPQPAYAPAPAPQPVEQPAASTNGTSSSSTPNRMASKYGDGFVTSASHPELANQYGNVGTSDPYHNTARPGTAQVSRTQKAPVSATLLDEGHLADISADYHPIRDCLLSLVEALKQTQLSPIDKRQLIDGEKAVAILLKRLGRGDIPADISEKVGAMTAYITSYDFRSAQSIQTGLVSHEWRDHKDWLKGVKALLLLATKKFEQ